MPGLRRAVSGSGSIRGAVAVPLLAAMVLGLSIALRCSGHGLRAASFAFNQG